jgi:hypothetical protein
VPSARSEIHHAELLRRLYLNLSQTRRGASSLGPSFLVRAIHSSRVRLVLGLGLRAIFGPWRHQGECRREEDFAADLRMAPASERQKESRSGFSRGVARGRSGNTSVQRIFFG